MLRVLVACCVVGWVSGLVYGASPTFSDGQKVEVREGDSWTSATIVRKEGRKYLIHYEGPDAPADEWVAADRVRVPGSSGEVAEAPATQPVAKAASFAVGQKVDVKWGGLWREAQIVRKQGAWTLVAYDKGVFREWVEPYRVRNVGSKEDEIGYATPNPTLRKNDNAPPPREKPEPAPEKLGSGGEKRDPTEAFKEEPTFKAADWDGAEKLDLLGLGGSWTITPDAAQVTASASSRAVALKGATDKPFDAMKAIVVPRGGGTAWVAHANSDPGHASDVRVEKIDLAAGKSAGVFPVTAGSMLMDVAPDGSAMLLRSDDFGIGKKDRLEVWTLEGTPKRVRVYFPYSKDEWHERDAESAMFVDAGHVLTVSRKGKLALWDVETCKAIYTCDVTANMKPALSAGGKYLAIQAGKFVFILEPMAGKVLAEIPCDITTGAALAFSPSGKTLAAWSDKFLQLWDMTTGKPTRDLSVAVNGTSIAMPSDDYVLVDGSILIDCQRRIPLWKYEVTKGATTVSTDGRMYFAIHDESRKLNVFNSCAIPDADASSAAGKLNADDMLLLHPGVRVSVSVNVEGTEAQRKQMMDSIKQRLEANQLIVADDRPIKVIASTEPGKTVQREYRTFGTPPWGPTQKVDVTEIISRLAVEVDGKVAWEARSVSEAGFMVMLKKGESMQDAVDAASKPNITMLKMARLPAYLPAPREPAWYGNSRMTANGPVQEPLHSSTPEDEKGGGHKRATKDKSQRVDTGNKGPSSL